MNKTRLLLVSIFAALTALAACSGQDEPAGDPTTNPGTEEPTPDPTPNPGETVTPEEWNYYCKADGDTAHLAALDDVFFVQANTAESFSAETLAAKGIRVQDVLKEGTNNGEAWAFLVVYSDKELRNHHDFSEIVGDENLYVGPVYINPNYDDRIPMDRYKAASRTVNVEIPEGEIKALRNELSKWGMKLSSGYNETFSVKMPVTISSVEGANILRRSGVVLKASPSFFVRPAVPVPSE